MLAQRGVDTAGVLEKNELVNLFLSKLTVREMLALLKERNVNTQDCYEKEALVERMRTIIQ